MKNKIDTIIFDLDYTLWNLNDELTFKKICTVLKIPYSKELEQEYSNIWCDFESKLQSKISNVDLVAQIIEEKATFLKYFGKTGKELLDAIRVSINKKLNNNVELVLEKLFEKGFKNIALTNWFYEDQVGNLKENEILKYFEKVYGFDNYYLKPHSKSIERVITRDPENYIIIGDSLNSDIGFARKAGIQSIWYNTNDKKNTTDLIPTYEIKDFIEVLDIVI